MLKNLLEQQAVNKPEETEPKNEKAAGESRPETADAPQYVEVNEAEDLFDPAESIAAPAVSEHSEFESVENIKSQIEAPAETDEFTGQPSAPSVENADTTANRIEQRFDSEENLSDKTKETTDNFVPLDKIETEKAASDSVISPDNRAQETKAEEPKAENTNTIFQTPAEPQSFAETARQSGLAYAAAITLFASVVFMLIIGWFADLLFGTSPWGKALGIVVGALIGFIQLFRISSQIFKK